MTYIGVTGFTNRLQVLEALSVFPHHSEVSLMVGVLASWKSLRNVPLKPQWQKQNPTQLRFGRIFLQDDRVENLIHYSCDEEHVETLFEDLVIAHDLAGPHVHGFQLNMAWPDPKVISRFLTRYELNATFVLQIGTKALAMADNSPSRVIERLIPYEGLIDAILLDTSGGRGIPFDPRVARGYLEAFDTYGLDFDLGVAGGLGPETLHLVEPLLLDFPELNIDAQGQLRTAEFDLDLEATKLYLQRALALWG